MRTFVLFPILIALLSPHLAAQTNAVGSWRAAFVGPTGSRPLTIEAVTFTVTQTAGGLAVKALAGSWPGELDVADVKLDGATLTFTGTGQSGWSTTGEGYRCCPKLMFTGTIEGDDMTLTMTWQTTDRPDDPKAHVYPMEAKRLSR